MRPLESSDRAIRHRLRTWPTARFLHEQRAIGRENLSPDWIARYAAEHDTAADMLERDLVGYTEAGLARLLTAITAPIAALREDPVARYYPYTAANVLDVYVDATHDEEVRKRLCAEGVYGLLFQLGRFEADSILGNEPYSRERFDADVAHRRLDALSGAFRAWEKIANAVGAQAMHPQRYETLAGYAMEVPPLSAIVDFTCIPRTCFHDEVAFLRTIAVSELCFKGVRIALSQACRAIEEGQLSVAPPVLRQATAFVSLLLQAFRVLETMPVEHFRDFRAATGEASAVQSRNYQELDIALFGLNPEKVGTLLPVPHMQHLRQYAAPEHVSLRSLLHAIGDDDDAWAEIVAEATALDRTLLSWRGLHLSFALRYLKDVPVGTGGTSGAPYLRNVLRRTLFEGTARDRELLREMFAEWPEVQEFVELTDTIAPADRRWIGCPFASHNRSNDTGDDHEVR